MNKGLGRNYLLKMSFFSVGDGILGGRSKRYSLQFHETSSEELQLKNVNIFFWGRLKKVDKAAV